MLQKILYGMIHNSIWGSIAFVLSILLVASCTLFIVLCFMNRVLYNKYHLTKLKKLLVKKGRIRKQYIIFFWWMLITIIFSMVIFLFCERKVYKIQRIYVDSPLTHPTSIDVLFEEEVDDEVVEDSQTKYMRRLHISENEPISNITQDSIEARMEQLDSIYQIGYKVSGNQQKYSAEKSKELTIIRNTVSNMESDSIEDYKQEFDYWNELYRYYGYPSDLYQSSRAARDVIEVAHSSLDNQELLVFASEAIYQSETFLEYADRNINSRNQPIIKEVKDMAFNNGKVYYQLYIESKNRNYLEVYDKEFLVNAYVCMNIAKKEMIEDDVNFAIVNYYIGNICELMLKEMSKDNIYYETIIIESLEHYTKALECLNQVQNCYNEELNMRQNINDGISTVTALKN